MINFNLPAGLKPELFASLVLTRESIYGADRFICKTFPEVSKYSDKYKILSEFFEFKMIDRYIPEERSDEEVVEGDYWFTLQHLLNKAKVVGVPNVIKADIRVQ